MCLFLCVDPKCRSMFGKDYVVLLVFLLSVSRGVSPFDHALVLVSFAGVVSLGCFEFGSACCVICHARFLLCPG